jgi:hypothetical protein
MVSEVDLEYDRTVADKFKIPSDESDVPGSPEIPFITPSTTLVSISVH